MRHRFGLLTTAIVASVLAVYFLPALMRQDVYSNDAAQHISWMYRYSDPTLFPNCEMREYFSGVGGGLGFRSLYAVLARLIDAQIASELLPFPLALLTVFGAYSLGCGITAGNKTGGVASAATVLFGGVVGMGFNYMSPIAGGLQRSFALPILVYGVVGVTQRRTFLIGTMVVASAFFYPPVCLVLGLFQGLVWLVDGVQGRLPRKEALWILLSGCIALAELWRLHEKSAAYGPALTMAEMVRMPDFYSGGVFYAPILFTNMLGYVGGALPMSIPALLLWTIGVGASAWFLRDEIRREAWLLLLTGILLYALAYATLFRLYEPSRYALYSALVFHLMIVAPVCVALEARIRERIGKSELAIAWSRRLRHQGVRTGIAVTVVLAASCLVVHRVHAGKGGMSGDIPESVYRYLRTLPFDTCVAAHPIDANYVPLRSQRCVPLLHTVFNSTQRDFRQKLFREFEDVLSLMYAVDVNEIRTLQARLKCRIFLVNTGRYTNDYFATVKPTDAIVTRLRQRAIAATPVLLHPPESAVLFKDGAISVVDLDRLKL